MTGFSTIGRALLCAGVLGLAGCQMARPDPELRQASPAGLKERVRSTCVVTQSRLQGVGEAKVRRGCACYAARTMKALNADEIAAFRATSVFNATAREKALKAVDACGLKRP